MPNTRSYSQRTKLLLEDLLGNFSKSLYPDLGDIRLKILFHCGIPRPEGDLPQLDKLVTYTSSLCEKLIERCRKEDNVRQQAIDMIPKVVSTSEEAFVQESLNSLLDGIGQSKTLDLGILALVSCWDGNHNYWSALYDHRLERLFEIEPKERAEVTLDPLKCDRAHVSSRGNSIATFYGEMILFSGTYKLPKDEFEKYKWTLRLNYRRGVLREENLNSSVGSYGFELDTVAFGRYKSGLPLRLGLFANEEIRAEASIKIHLCGPDRTAFVLVEPAFEVIDARLSSDDETPDKKIQGFEPSHVYMFSYENEEPRLMDDDENELPVIETGQEGIWRSGHRIDPSEDASGQVKLICKFGLLSSVICLETNDIERGEFTIEDEIRVQISGQREGNLKELISIFEGENQEPYRRLGNLNDRSRKRILLANDMTSERGWRPLIVDLLTGNYDNAGVLGDYVNYRGLVEAPAFNNVSLPPQALELIQEYASTRFSAIKEVLKNTDKTGYSLEHPDYATHPIFVDKNSPEINEVLQHYLNTYLKVLDYVGQSHSTLDWSQLFVLVYLDHIVHWDNSTLRNSIFLVGPWHPLVLVKRFLTQASLFERAKGLEEDDGKRFRQLAPLLREINGFRWLIGLHRNDRLLEPLYVMPTSDPGWHMAIKQDLSTIAVQSSWSSLVGILERLKDELGLESSLAQGYTEDLAKSSVANFMRAYPSRRSMGVRVRGGYSPNEIISSLDTLLHEEDGPTELGLQMPGGIHLYTKDLPDESYVAGWPTPPISIYQYENDQECFCDARPDLYLLAPAREVYFRPGAESYQLPRGVGMHAIFSEPLFWLTEGQSQLPNSISLEFDQQPSQMDNLGETFVGVTAKISQVFQNRVVMVRSVDLPQRLDCPWVVVPGGGIDPAIFVKYVRDGADRSFQDRALWDYRFDITGSKNTYYVLSTIPRGFTIAVNGFFGRKDIASKFIEDLGSMGIAIGGEALKSGRHALGVVGLVGAIRLLKGIGGSGRDVFGSNSGCVGFLIPVDSFMSFFDGRIKANSENGSDFKRSDLLAIRLMLPDGENSNLYISASGIESKFVSHTFNQARAIDALKQAQASLNQFRSLVETSLKQWAVPERLGLLAIIKFGLRITSPNRQGTMVRWIETERVIMQAILQGKYQYRQAEHDAVVISTEGQLHGAAEVNTTPDGMWVRINRENWPGINDTPELEKIRDEISHLFGGQKELQSIPPAKNNPDTISPTTTGAHGNQEPLRIPDDDVIVRPDDNKFDKSENVDNFVAQVNTDDRSTAVPIIPSGPLRKILLGFDDARRPVYYDPQSPVDPLDNLNLMISGSSGTGKTQLLKYLICKFREQGKNVLVLDFKNDFASDRVFSSRASLNSVYVNFSGLPFNPLIPYPIHHPGTGELVVQTGQHISGLASVLKRTYGLGPQQQIAVKNSIADAFSALRIPTTGTSTFNESMEFPDFNNVGTILQGVNPMAYNRLDPLFTLDLFRAEYRKDSFRALVNQSMILDLSQIPSNEIKNTLAELIVLSAHAYYNTQSHSGTIRQILVFDEAHRVLGSDYMINLVRECRAYGVGIILSSQYPTDFPAQISSSMATKILHSNGRDADRVKAIVQIMGCAGREAEVSNLDRFQAFIDNRHSPHTSIRTMNYPLYLVWSFLFQRNQTTRDELNCLEGIDKDKLPMGNILKQLERLGLIEEKDGHIRLLQYNE